MVDGLGDKLHQYFYFLEVSVLEKSCNLFILVTFLLNYYNGLDLTRAAEGY